MSQFTDITILIDRSGSMSSCKTEMDKGIAEFIKTHSEVPTSKVTIVQFDSDDDQEFIYKAEPIGEVRNVTIMPRGSTPLCDAFVKCIENSDTRINSMKVDQRPDQVLFLVITDGLENASRTYGKADVNQAVTRLMGLGWQFVYLGANHDAIAEATTLGVPVRNSSEFIGANADEAWKSTSANTLAYANRQSGFVPDYTDTQRAAMITPRTPRRRR